MEHIMDEEDVEGFYKAKIQILEHNLHRAARNRDEFKMQLDAANKEIKILKDAIFLCSGSCKHYRIPKVLIPMISSGEFPDIVQSEITSVKNEI